MTAAAPLQLARVHGRDGQGPGGRPLGRLHNVTLLVHPGVHAFVGSPADGTAALCDLCSGRRRPQVGAVLVMGRAPSQSARVRARIGTLLAHPELGGRGTVAAEVAQVAAIRGADPSGTLEAMGLGSLAARTLASLRYSEARAVELALALSLPDPIALVLHEPFTSTDPIDRAAVRERLVERAARGACVVVTASSASDVETLASAVHLLDGGKLASSRALPGWGAGRPRELCVWLDGPRDEAPRRLAQALGARPEIHAVRWRAHGDEPALVAVEAGSLEQAALVLAEVVAAERIPIAAVRAAPLERTTEGAG